VWSDRGEQRLITLNGMKVSEELTEEQSRQVHPVTLNAYTLYRLILWEKLLFDVDHAYAEFFRSLGGGKEDGS
jgi:ESCRT-I complex subunit VPS28